MKKILILFNSPYLGGAERSMMEQSKILKSSASVEYLIPYLITKSEACDLLEELTKADNSTIHYLKFPSTLFSFSRSGVFPILRLILMPFFMSLLLHRFRKIKINEFDIVWANGNKIAVPSLIYLWLSNYRKKFFWHLRDYPNGTAIWRYVWKLASWVKSYRIEFIANSNSVRTELLKLLPTHKCTTIYNPIDTSNLKCKDLSESISIGVVSMLAPWKGLHHIVLWAAMFEKELRELNVDQVAIYGADIYKTKGSHQTYLDQLKLLKEKLGANLIVFKGIKKPEEIYREIDLLIHSSIEAEPFGRVIAEAQACGIPVITTGIGGASELICGNSGVKYLLHDYDGLQKRVEEVLTNSAIKSQLISNGKQIFYERQLSIKDLLSAQTVD